jgi:plasmid stabilization system protein ParE
LKRFVLTQEARGDLQEIWDFIAQDSAESADRVLEAFYRAFGQIAGMPGMGHRREDLTKQDVLFWPVHSYLVVYRAESKPILVVALLHGKRNVKKVLKDR